MVVTVKYADGSEYIWSFGYANDINKLIIAMTENIDPHWDRIEIKITNLGPDLRST